MSFPRVCVPSLEGHIFHVVFLATLDQLIKHALKTLRDTLPNDEKSKVVLAKEVSILNVGWSVFI